MTAWQLARQLGKKAGEAQALGRDIADPSGRGSVRTRNPHLFPDCLDLNERLLRSPVIATDADEIIRQKIIAGLTPARNP